MNHPKTIKGMLFVAATGLLFGGAKAMESGDVTTGSVMFVFGLAAVAMREIVKEKDGDQ